MRGHKLLTKEIRNSLPPLYSTENVPLAEKLFKVKFFSPYSSWTWYASEGSPILDDDGNEIDYQFFGYVQGFEGEWGYFYLSELENAKVFGGIPAVERDLYWEEKRFEEINV